MQVALDIADGKEAIKIAREVYKLVDIIERGTPLLKSEGARIVKRLKEEFPTEITAIPLAIAGGIKFEDIDLLLNIKPRIIIVGVFITRSRYPGKAARRIKTKIEKTYKGRVL